MHQGGVEHAGFTDIAGIDRRAIDLGGAVEPCQRLTDELELRGIFERDIAHLGQRDGLAVGCGARLGDQGTEADRAEPRMGDRAGCRGAFGRRHRPLACRQRDQGGTRCRTRLTHRQPKIWDAGGPAGRHHAHEAGRLVSDITADAPQHTVAVGRKGQHALGDEEIAVDQIDRRLLDADLAPIAVELLGEQHGETRVHALSHLAARHDHRDRIVGADLDPAVEGELPILHRQRCLAAQPRGCRQHRPSDHQSPDPAEARQQHRASFHDGGMIRRGTSPRRQASLQYLT